jgi:DNA-binding NarL/FixJ family response regulator
MPTRRSTDAFVGRDRELAAVRAELDRVRRGEPRVVLIEGPPGIGKSALIDHILADHADLTILRATGEQWEAFVAYGVVDQLMRSAGISRAKLLAGRGRSLPTEEPVGIGSQVLEAIEDLEPKAPVALVIDDAHWADLDSLRALLFVVRRMVGIRVLVLFAVRSEDADRVPEGLRRQATGTTGTTVAVGALGAGEVALLAAAWGVPQLSGRSAGRLQAHTAGNPLYITTLLAELPHDRWQTWEPMLPAPRTFATQVMRRLDACSPPTRRLVEAAAVLGANATLDSTAAIAEVPDLIDALDEAAAVNLLKVPDDSAGIRGVMFSHPLVQAAVYGQLGPSRRVQLHSAAAELVEDPAAVLRHRVMATTPPDPALAAELEGFARRKAGVGAWAGAAWALVEGSRLSADRAQRERLLLKAVDAMIGAGDLIQADAFAQEVAGFAPAAMGDATMGYLAVLRGRPGDAEKLLRAAWKYCDTTGDATLGTAVAQRLALHGVGRLRGDDVVRWSRRAMELAVADDPVRVEAEALLGLGLGWQGNVPEGLAAYESILARLSSQEDGPPEDRVRMAYGWLRLVTDDVVGARTMLAQTAVAALRAGSVRIAVWALVWSAHAGFAVGAWDEAAADADRAVSLLEETGHEWLRPLARCAAVLVPAARGEWTTAEEHARAAIARPGDYELMVVAAALAQAHLAAARTDHDGVIRALEPVLLITPRDGVDESGFWPWPGLYADALVNSGRLTEAHEFLEPHEKHAAARGLGSTVARLARVRGRIEAANGRMSAAESAFRLGLAELERVPMPFQRALLELAYGQVLRRAGQRRAAAHQLQAARDRLAGLRARPYLELCERELAACGLAPAKRSDFDPSRLTAQESAVARLVALGMGNRQVASELFVSIKTVQFHLTHIYAKLGISTRAELAAQLRDNVAPDDIPPLGRPGQDGDRAHLDGPGPPSGDGRSPIARRGGIDRLRLTPQESAVARLVAVGMGNQQVATELFVSIKTVQFHLTHIYAKLGVSTRAELAAQLLDSDTTDRTPAAHDSGPDRCAGEFEVERCEGTIEFCGSSARTPRTSGSRRLTRQELAVARLVAMGKANRQIAADLFIGVTTVRFHLTHICTKLGFRSRAELAAGFRDKHRS